MSELTATFNQCKDLLRPYSKSIPDPSSVESITNCLFELLDDLGDADQILSGKISQLLMCLSEDPLVWTEGTTQNHYRLIDELLTHRLYQDDPNLDNEPYVIFRPSEAHQGLPKNREQKESEELIVEFARESEILLFNAIEFIFRYETSPDPTYLIGSSALLRQIVASAQLLEQRRFGQATQSLIVLFEHCAVVERVFHNRTMLKKDN